MSPDLSVSIITRNSADWLARAIAQARRFAGEVVVGVDFASTDATWEVATASADTAWRFSHHGQLAPAHRTALQFCRGQWVLRLDDDETMEEGFEALAPVLLSAAHLTHYAFRRKWVVSEDPPEYLHAPLWYPDWQVRLFRNDASLVWKPPRYHSGMLVAGPGVQEARVAILHYEPLRCSPAARVEKLGAYRAGGAPVAAEAQYGERLGERRSFVPPQQSPQGWSGIARSDDVVHELIPARLPPWGCRIRDLDVPQHAVAGRPMVVSLIVENTGRMTWVPYQETGWPRLTIGIHIKSPSGEILEWDGPRVHLRAPAPPGQSVRVIGTILAPTSPGDYVFVWDMVSEGECWFEACGHTPVETPVRIDAAD